MSSSGSHPTFDRGLRPVVAALVFVAAVATISNVGRRTLLGVDLATHVEIVWQTPFFLILALGCWWLLRYEGATLSDVGMGRAAVAPGVLAFAGFWVLISFAGVGYLQLTGAPGEIGSPFETPWYWALLTVLLTLLANGVVEEFVFRGYVQNKCIAVLDHHTRVPALAGGLLLASVSFGIVHVPAALVVEEAAAGAVPWVVLSNLVPGVLFGITYHLTRNVWFVGLAHGFANALPVPFAPDAVAPFTAFVTLGLTLVTAAYWYWRTRSEHATAQRRERVSEPP